MSRSTTRGRTFKGDRLECPVCHRRVGYWPDKLDYHVGHLMRHLVPRNRVVAPPLTPEWCEGTTYVG